jgi:hypothetical protein
LSDWTVHLSKPFPYGDYWAYVLAVDGTFERRLFKTQGGANDHWSIEKQHCLCGPALSHFNNFHWRGHNNLSKYPKLGILIDQHYFGIFCWVLGGRGIPKSVVTFIE